MRDVLEPADDPAWLLEQDGYDPMREHDAEARFAVANGCFGVRGAREVSRAPTWVSWTHSLNWGCSPRTYVAGLFGQPDIEPRVPALIPAPNWLCVRLVLDGEALRLHSGHILRHRRTLDMRRGTLLLEWHQRTPGGVEVCIRTLRLASQADRAIGLQMLCLQINKAGVEVAFEAEFDGAGPGLETVRLGDDSGLWRAEQSGKRLALATAASLRLGREELTPSALGPLQWRWEWRSDRDQTVSFERMVAVARDDDARDDARMAAQDALRRARGAGATGVLAAHEAAWADRWRCSDVEVEGDPAAQRALRFAVYHLTSAVHPADERASIGARALTGDSYWGHIFWDTEIFLLPFYTLTWPEAARTLLMYRHRTLDEARAKAARMGWHGALYPWESADTGEEVSPPYVFGPDGRPVAVLCGEQQQHVTAAVAYAVWHYWQASGDQAFLLEAGAEMLLETARFWASRAQPEPDGQHHIRGVIGPDEYHEGVEDNAYTNRMARWNIRRALDIAGLLRARWPEHWDRLVGRLQIGETELAQWRAVGETMATRCNATTGVLEQFAGYFGLESIDLAQFAERGASMEAVLGRQRAQRSQIIKQADVVALLALLPDEFDTPAMAANFRFYESRCAHGSSLSRPMHALAAARLGETELALRYFHEAAAIDLGDAAGDSAGGIRIAGLGGLWQVAVLGFAGLSWRDDVLALDPKLPHSWRRLGFRVHWRGRRLSVRIDQTDQTIDVRLEAGEPLSLSVLGEVRSVTGGAAVRTPLPGRLAARSGYRT